MTAHKVTSSELKKLHAAIEVLEGGLLELKAVRLRANTALTLQPGQTVGLRGKIQGKITPEIKLYPRNELKLPAGLRILKADLLQDE